MMTIKETIEWLRAIEEKFIRNGDEGFDKKRHEAINSAVFYLEKLEKENKQRSD
jgi:hypothetical protein